MNISQLFLQRYDALYTFWLAGIWTTVTEAQLRQRPHPRVNSIAWNLWHLSRVEDAGLNRFVVDQPQVLDEMPWMRRMNVLWRHNGCEMTFAEVDDLSQGIDLQALRDYMDAVQRRTREIINQIHQDDLDAVMDTDRLRMILFDGGLAHPQAAGLLDHYLGWTKGKCLMNFGLSHPYQHVGEIGVIASLHGVEFE